MHGAWMFSSVVRDRVNQFLEPIGVAVEPAQWLHVDVDGVLGRAQTDVGAGGLLEKPAR
jgi:hypothetical protein